MRQYFLGPIKWCLQEDQRRLNQAGHAPDIHTLTLTLPHEPTAPQESLIYWKCHCFMALLLPKLPQVCRPNSVFSCNQSRGKCRGAGAGVTPACPGHSPPSQPCLCPRHEEKGSNGSQRIIWQWAGEIIGSFKAGMSCTAMQAQNFFV